jgi:hypothetical protein
MKKQVKDETVKFRVGYEFTIKGKKYTGEETEASWYLIDQQGGFYSYGPIKPIRPCIDEDKLEFRLKIGEEYLTVSEIEKRLKGI